MELNDIRLGDTVRLRNGETIQVAAKMTSYTDADGEHEGPFVAIPRTYDHFYVSDILEVVERNERVCRYCGEGVTAKDEETNYCSLCFYSGRAYTEERGGLLATLAKTQGVESAHFWHTGGGCFLLAVTLSDQRLLTFTDGDASLPQEGETWGLLVISPNLDAFDEWDEDRLDIRYGEWTDEQLLAAVAKIASTDAKVVSLDGERQYREELASGRDPRD
jgi:hypothetical protein